VETLPADILDPSTIEATSASIDMVMIAFRGADRTPSQFNKLLKQTNFEPLQGLIRFLCGF
jgi:hypothetical protein